MLSDVVSDLNKNFIRSTDLAKKGTDRRICIPLFTPLFTSTVLLLADVKLSAEQTQTSVYNCQLIHEKYCFEFSKILIMTEIHKTPLKIISSARILCNSFNKNVAGETSKNRRPSKVLPAHKKTRRQFPKHNVAYRI